MGSTLEVVERHFDDEAERFDAIYEEAKPFHHRLMDRFRRVVVERLMLTRNLAPVRGQWSICDVGCGPGRYTIQLARDGATRAVGIDVAANMITLAQSEAQRAGVGDRCEFVLSGFLDAKLNERFDVVVAMGYFDYVENPADHLRKMASICDGRVIASFPKRWEWRTPIRKLRFLLRRSFVRLYSMPEVHAAFQAAGIKRESYSLIDLGRDWIAVARVRHS
jgi:2-polyprenyl-3-methyl-5-hydroxy-6-metoxy-1,4-benzoquinol methylase